jgi:copper chaperone CopZ
MTRWTWAGLLAAACVGCQSQTVDATKTEPAGEATEVAGPDSGSTVNLQVVNFSVPGMHCEFACVPKVRKVLEALPGVAEVQVDLPSKVATVRCEEGKFDAAAAVAALVDVRFDDARQITSQEADEAKAQADAAADSPATEETDATDS